MTFHKCAESKDDKIICVKENHSSFCLDNKSKKTVLKIKVDGCLITGAKKRCDWLFEIDKPFNKVFYVELKGSDIKKAYEQLVSTIEYCSSRHHGKEKSAYIVCSKSKPAHTTQVQIYKTILLKKSVKLIIKNRSISVAI